MIKLLLENPLIDVNSKSFVNKTEYEETALNLALRNNDKEIIKILLKHQNIDLNVISTSKEDNYSNIEINEYTVLQTAIEFCDIEIIELILNNSKIDINHLSKSTKINDNDNTKQKSKMAALHTAIILKKKDVVPLLLKNENIQINLNGVVYIKYVKYKMNPLNMAIYYQQNEICRELLSNSNIDVNSNLKIKKKNEFYNLKPSLFLAVEKKMFEIVQLLLLLHQKIDVNAKSYYAEMSMTKIEETFILHKAFEMNNLDIIKCLINSDDIDFNVVSTVKKNEVELYEETSNTTFYYAIELGNIEIIKLLLEKQNIDLNMKSYLFKSSPKFSFNVEKGLLLNALQSNNKEIFKLLVDYALMNDTKLIPENFIDFIKMTNDDEVKGIIFNVVNSNEFS